MKHVLLIEVGVSYHYGVISRFVQKSRGIHLEICFNNQYAKKVICFLEMATTSFLDKIWSYLINIFITIMGKMCAVYLF